MTEVEESCAMIMSGMKRGPLKRGCGVGGGLGEDEGSDVGGGGAPGCRS